MKKGFLILSFICLMFFVVSCSSIYRDYQDDELESLALRDYGFDSFSIFKIIDIETATMLTGEPYQNSGVIIGKIRGEFKMLFIPRKVAETPFFVGNQIYFNLDEIYAQLHSLDINPMFLQDYGSLSISVVPYHEILIVNQNVVFDSRLFFVVTTDGEEFYCNYVDKSLVIYDINYNLIN